MYFYNDLFDILELYRVYKKSRPFPIQIIHNLL